ncbi:5100_t:CDS:2 [Funneliformis mosseae]|uniref:5100_t:CDS:1 n=1 Tax=Funneliformis mosseae TaxID=27381 RepID=A0A9N8Z4P4_FUNMO|nr:5100_t:CDS:2 [Funneliformis mosseae]
MINNNNDSSTNDNDELNTDKEIPKSLIISIDERSSRDSKKITAELTNVIEEKEVNENSEDNPFNWPKRKKWLTLVVLSCGAIISPISCFLFYPAVLEVRKQLHTTSILTNASVSIFIIFQGIGPLGCAAYSDSRQTRRHVYIFSLILFIVTSVICAITNNIWLLILIRSVQACGSSALHAIGPTTISDMFVAEELGNAFGFFYLFPIFGPLIGPVIGGYVTEYLGWRCKVYNLTASKIGLVFLSPALGYMLGSVIGGKYTDYVLRKAKRIALIAQQKEIEKIIEKGENDTIMLESVQVEPEIRIHGIWIGVIIIPTSFLAYGWLLENRISIIFPLILMFLGFGQILVYTTMFTYLVESFPTQSASIAANSNFSRQLVAGLLSLFSVPIYEALGVGWTFSLVAFLKIIGTLLVIVVIFKGKQWRLKFKQDFNLN